MYVHRDGHPSHHLPLLLAAYQHTFARDLDAFTRYLIDNAPIGWSTLGADLLVGTPEALRTELVGPNQRPGRQFDDLRDSAGTIERQVITEATFENYGLEWAYVLHPSGIQVTAVGSYKSGPVVGWNTDPRSRIIDYPQLWTPDGPPPVTAQPRPTSLTATSTTPAPAPARAAARRS